MLTPADIDGIQFPTTRLREGYDQDEVDSFLDRVAEDYKFLQQQVARLEAENETLRRVQDNTATTTIPTVAQTPSAVAERLLAVAQQAADQTQAEAQAKADDLVREGGAKAAALVEEATAAAEKIKNDGLAEKYRRQQELDARHDAATAAHNELLARAKQLRTGLNEALIKFDQEVPK
jgi:DivIVA domain-containing protein